MNWIPGHTIPAAFELSRTLEQELDLPAGWIERRTGICRRSIAAEHQTTSTLAVEAGRQALDKWQGDASSIALVLLASSTPDQLLPPTSPRVVAQLGLHCGALDVSGSCTGFISALTLAHSYQQSCGAPVLVIAANVLSRRLSATDPQTRPLFADGAAALVVTDGAELLAQHWGSDGEAHGLLNIPEGGSHSPFSVGTFERGGHLMQMQDVNQLYRRAVRRLSACSLLALEDAQLTVEDIDWWVPHPGNQRLLDTARQRLGFPAERTLSTLREHGNSSAVTIPLALSLAHDQGHLKPGQTLLLSAVGAGLLECALVLRW